MNREGTDIPLAIIAALLGLFLFFASFSIAASQIALGMTLTVAAIVVAKRRINPFADIPRSVLAAIAAWLLWLMIASLVNANSAASLLSLRDNWLFLILPVVMLVWRKHTNLLVSCLAIGMILIGLLGIWQYLFGSTPFRSMELAEAPGFGHRATGYFSLLVTFGNLFAISSAGLFGLLTAGRGRLSTVTIRLAWTAVSIGAGAVLFNFSRASIVGLLITVLITLIFATKSKRWLIAAVPALVILAGFFIPGVTDRFRDQWDRDIGGVFEGGRVFIWKQTVPLIEENPIFGVGSANFRTEYVQRLRPDISELHKHSHAHNDFLHISATTGLPGLVMYLIIWVVILRILLRAGFGMRSIPSRNFPPVVAALAASVCFLTLSLFHDPFYDEEVRQVLMFFWAVGLTSAYKASTEKGALRHRSQTP